MKTKLMLIIFVALSVQLKAQVAQLGIHGGVSTEKIRIENSPQGFSSLVDGSGIVGGEAGLFLQLNVLSPLYLRPMAVVHFGSGDVEYYNSEGTTTDGSFSYMKFQVPVMIGLKILGPLSIQGGPVYNYILFTSKDGGTRDFDINKNGMGYRFGAEVQVTDHIMIGGSYQGESHNGSSSDAVFKVPYTLTGYLGILLGGGKDE